MKYAKCKNPFVYFKDILTSFRLYLFYNKNFAAHFFKECIKEIKRMETNTYVRLVRDNG